MNGNEYLTDTNILIYLFDGNTNVGELLNKQHIFISFISEVELLSKPALSNSQITILKKMLKDFYIISFNDDIKELTINYRRTYNLKLPDAIVAATSKFLSVPLITADKAFRKIKDIELVLIDI